MLRRLVAIATVGALAASLAPSSGARGPADERPRVEARVDPRIELMSVVFRLAGNPEYGQGKVSAYERAVEERFGKFRDHPVVRHAAALRRQYGVSYDAVMSLAVHLDDGLRLSMPPEKAERLDARWPRAELKPFVEELRQFAKDADAPAFFRAQKDLYDLTGRRCQALLDEHVRLAWFDTFFGARPTARFALAVGLGNGGGNYGPSVRRPDGTEELHCVLGVWETDAEGHPVFGDGVVSTVVHEFCHSYANALVDAHWPDLEPAAKRIWPHVADAMAAQAYGDPRTMLRESLVRACVVRYQADAAGAEAAAREVAAQEERSFPWTGELSGLLADYETLRAAHPTLDTYMPRVATFFADYAERFARRMATVPKVVDLVPRNGARDVDPALAAIVVTFDRPMTDQSWSVVGGGPHFPTLAGKPHYDEARRVLTIPVRLRPSWDYDLWLNRGKFDSFMSAEGVRLQPVHVTFSTRGP